ncbi:HupE/UreJ family protein [Pedobacter changchengzhani]|uniref:HupE/UreJ family protein n=1 Tax=Pedobacter changchengzhani TaxID=2529274 RepID=A0A4R5MPE9_9SPHI|nr:HupE/UreJ family protein [Pedobacter changchengzhani]TDG37205.1 HupE/UreJ family protein [Pedobacter changchengzhani]
MPFQDFVFYFKLGWQHIVSLDALDHQLFILALVAIYTYKNFKQVLILVTAFTIGHSITLLLSVLDIIRFSSKWVEFLIPCTIFITAISNLLRKNFSLKSIRINYYLALFFGLVHGMGFANSVRMMLASNENISWGLFGFNVGLEFGQIFMVLIILLITFIIFNYTHIKRLNWVIFVSAAVFALSLQMALQRLPF